MKNALIYSFLIIGIISCNLNSPKPENTDTAAQPLPAESPNLNLPPAIQVLPTDSLLLKVHAVGFQMYTWENTGKWSAAVPLAVLLNEQGEIIGIHENGPSWMLYADGSKVIGDRTKLASDTTKSAGTIPWLRLEALSQEGSGILSEADKIQRVDTKGGKAPATGKPGEQVRVPYTATYYFYKDSSNN